MSVRPRVAVGVLCGRDHGASGAMQEALGKRGALSGPCTLEGPSSSHNPPHGGQLDLPIKGPWSPFSTTLYIPGNLLFPSQMALSWPLVSM